MEGMIVTLNPELSICEKAIPFCVKAQALHLMQGFMGGGSPAIATSPVAEPSIEK
jgi:hypothetical protein